MSIFGMGTEAYLYVNGLIINEEIRINENKILMPVQCKPSIDILSQSVKNDVDFAVLILCERSITSQMKIIAENPKNLAAEAWNSQWDLVLLSAIFKCDAVCNLQCTHPIDAITDDATLKVTNYHLRGLFGEPYTITKEDTEWLKRYFANAQSLLDNNSFSTAIHSMATYRWHTMPKVQLAILWAGIESLFGINSELSFRISLYISNFLAGSDKDKAKGIFDETKSLYKARSSAVHGDNIRGDLDSFVEKSSSLLNKLIIKCVVANEMPNVEDLIY